MSHTYYDPFYWHMQYRLIQAGDYLAQEAPAPWDHPCFPSCKLAASNVLRVYPGAQRVCVMPDECLAAMRIEVLMARRTLIVPTHDGKRLVEIPMAAMRETGGGRYTLHIDDVLKDGAEYSGAVDVIVVSALAFNAQSRRVYSFEYKRTADVIRAMRSGEIIEPPVGSAPVVLLAADAQEITGWPEYALGAHEADVAITATRSVVLGSGRQILFPKAVPQ